MQVITVEKVIKEVRKLAEESPECVYQSDSGDCLYDSGQCSNGSVGCIFGQALRRLGVTKKLDNLSDAGFTSCASGLMKELGLRISDDQEYWCDKVQECQDDGSNWRNAVEKADCTYGIL